MKSKIIYSVFLMCLLLSSFTFTACKDEPTKEAQLKLIQQLWVKDGAGLFLDQFNGYTENIAQINSIEVIDKKEANNTGENEKEIKMIIKVNGSINTSNYTKENFSVKHNYYFIKNKFGEWIVGSDHRTIK